LPPLSQTEPTAPQTNDSAAWSAFHARWSRLRAPLRPNADTVAATARQIADRDDHVLMLGVTADLAHLGRRMTAVDWSSPMIANVWPGDSESRKAVLADWRTMPVPDRPFTAAIGDGSLATLLWPQDYRAVFARLADVLATGARLAVRCYLTPDDPEPLDRVRDATMAGSVTNFHALKWRVAMAVAGAHGDPNVPVTAILAAFEHAFPDRTALAEATGWTLEQIAEIDAYRGGTAVYSFVTRGQLAAALPSPFGLPRYVDAGSYELAERCPLLVADFRP